MVEARLTKPRSGALVKPVVFLGGGRITAALVAGLRLVGYKPAIVVYDRHPEKLRELKRKYDVLIERDLLFAVARARILIVAVRPLDVANLLEEVAQTGSLSRAMLVISLAAGIPLRKLRSRLDPHVRWARAMPSPVCRVARGLTALTFDRKISSHQRKEVREFFEHVGPVVEIPESCFDAFTAAFSPSHGYHALATLAKTAQQRGLAGKTALTAAAHALTGGILYWQDSGQTLDELVSEAATPGGTAAATMSAMNRAGYEKAVARGLRAGMNQARTNAKDLSTKC